MARSVVVLLAMVVLSISHACRSSGPATGEHQGSIDEALQYVKAVSSNPSLGPHEVTQTSTLRATSFATPEAFRAELRRLVHETRVNGDVTLATYLAMHRQKQHGQLARVHAKYEPPLATGAGILSLEFGFADDIVRIPDVRRVRLEGYYPQFFEHFGTKGGWEKEASGPSDAAPLAP